MNPAMLLAAGPLIAVLTPVLILLAIWDGVWKAIGMWKSARNDQLVWFICITIFNTAGILPIVYILFFQKKAIGASKGKKR